MIVGPMARRGGIKEMFKIKSKMHNFGLLLGIFGGIQQFLPMAKEYIPQDDFGVIFIGVGIAVIVLRNVTTQPITDK